MMLPLPHRCLQDCLQGPVFIKLIDVDTVRIFWALISPLGYAASGCVWASNGLLQHERDVVPRHGAALVPAG